MAGKNRQKRDQAGKARTAAPGRGEKQFSGPSRKPARKPSTDAPARSEVKDTRSDGQKGTDYSARPVTHHSGALPKSLTPVILETLPDEGYELLDSGDGLKLERYGPHKVIRPEAQALWPKRLNESVWAAADAIFTGDTDEDGAGRWAFPGVPLGEMWPMRLLDVDFYARLTAFRHVGVFPEQLAHWRYMAEKISARRHPPKVLNLFGYTGVASLIAAHAGAEVTHVDASKKAIGWARENQQLAGLEKKPIRWICDDAMKFLLREERRGSRYDLILADPPKFGRGPTGEVWQLFEHLPLMLDLCRSLMSDRPIGTVLTAYSIRASFYSIHELMRETMRGKGGSVESGELIIREGEAGTREPRALSTSLFSRWTPDER